MGVTVHGLTATRVFSQTGATGNFPAGVQTGDLLVMAVGCQDQLGVIATPAGWTRQLNAISTAAGGRASFALYTKLANGDETGSITVQVTGLGAARHNEVAIWRTSGGVVGDSAMVLDSGWTTTQTMPPVTVEAATSPGGGPALLCGVYTLRNEGVTYSDINLVLDERDRFLSATYGAVDQGIYAGETASQLNPANALTYAIVIEPAPEGGTPTDVVAEPATFEFWFSGESLALPRDLSLSLSITPPAVTGERKAIPQSLTMALSMSLPAVGIDADGTAMFRVFGEWKSNTADGAWTLERSADGAWRIV